MILLLPSGFASLHRLAVLLVYRWVGLHWEAAAHQDVVDPSLLQLVRLF